MNWLNFITSLISLMLVTSVITSLLIEVCKNIFDYDKLIKRFGKIEIFSLFITSVCALITYLIYLLFFVTLKNPLTFIDIMKFIVCGIIYIVSCASGSQVGYDKVIKIIHQIIKEKING